jgi:hypothetical protein
MGKNVSHSITKKSINKLGFRYYTPAVKLKINEEYKKIDKNRHIFIIIGSVNNGNK